MTSSPAFQFYPADFLFDENVVLMSLAGRGAYITLLCYCWREGSIPADMTRLGRMCGTDSSAMAQLWSELEACFEKAGDRYIHPRLEKERIKQQEYKAERSESGKKGALSRWLRASEENKEVTLDGLAIAQPKGELLASDASLSSSLSSSSEKEKKRSRSLGERSRRSQVCDEEFLKELQAKPAYAQLDVIRLFNKMTVWCEQKGKQPTRMRLVNWLNREDVPMNGVKRNANPSNGTSNQANATNGSHRGADSGDCGFQAARTI